MSDYTRSGGEHTHHGPPPRLSSLLIPIRRTTDDCRLTPPLSDNAFEVPDGQRRLCVAPPAGPFGAEPAQEASLPVDHDAPCGYGPPVRQDHIKFVP